MHLVFLKKFLKAWKKTPGEMEIRGKLETIQTTALLRSARIQSPEDLQKLAVNKTPVKELVRKV